MSLATRTGSLAGEHVELVPLDPSFAADLAASAAFDRATYRFTTVPDSEEAATRYIAALIAERERGGAVPFAQRQRSTGRLVGCTRFMELRWWRGRDEPDEVEIGGTWLGADVQRSPLNTEAKLLMFTHAFEAWRVRRVALCTDERNERSRAAIERLGGRFEGILRNHRYSHVPEEAGQPRNSAMFGVTDDDWPNVRARLLSRLRAPR